MALPPCPARSGTGPVRNTRPANPACPARTARITATYSSVIASGANGWSPNLPFMTGFPTPRPRTSRPPDAWSSCAAVSAVSTGGRSAAFAIAVPTRTLRVAAATGWQSASASPCPSATKTAAKPARSAAAARAPILAGGSPLCEAMDSPILAPVTPAYPGSVRPARSRCRLSAAGPDPAPLAGPGGGQAFMNVPPGGL